MTTEQFNRLTTRHAHQFFINTLDLHDLSDRTLLLSTEEKATNLVIRHLYIEAGTFHKLTYFRTIKRKPYFVNQLIAKQRLSYNDLDTDNLVPQCCDAEFCHLIAGFGLRLNFDVYKEIDHRDFYALRINQSHLGVTLEKMPFWM